MLKEKPVIDGKLNNEKNQNDNPNEPKKRVRRFTKRSREGCQTCIKRKKKCDETFPVCQNCKRIGRECTWRDKIRFKTPTVFKVPISNTKESKTDSVFFSCFDTDMNTAAANKKNKNLDFTLETTSLNSTLNPVLNSSSVEKVQTIVKNQHPENSNFNYTSNYETNYNYNCQNSINSNSDNKEQYANNLKLTNLSNSINNEDLRNTSNDFAINMHQNHHNDSINSNNSLNNQNDPIVIKKSLIHPTPFSHRSELHQLHSLAGTNNIQSCYNMLLQQGRERGEGLGLRDYEDILLTELQIQSTLASDILTQPYNYEDQGLIKTNELQGQNTDVENLVLDEEHSSFLIKDFTKNEDAYDSKIEFKRYKEIDYFPLFLGSSGTKKERELLNFWMSTSVPFISVVERNRSAFLLVIVPMMTHSAAVRNTILAWAAIQKFNLTDAGIDLVSKYYRLATKSILEELAETSSSDEGNKPTKYSTSNAESAYLEMFSINNLLNKNLNDSNSWEQNFSDDLESSVSSSEIPSQDSAKSPLLLNSQNPLKSKDHLIAACLLMCGIESQDGGSSWLHHLSAVRRFIGSSGGEKAYTSSLDKRKNWLLRSFLYHDVLSSLTIGSFPLFSDLSALGFEEELSTPPGKQIFNNISTGDQNFNNEYFLNNSSFGSIQNNSNSSDEYNHEGSWTNMLNSGKILSTNDEMNNINEESLMREVNEEVYKNDLISSNLKECDKERDKLMQLSNDVSNYDSLMYKYSGIFCLLWRISRLAHENFLFPENMLVVFTTMWEQVNKWTYSTYKRETIQLSNYKTFISRFSPELRSYRKFEQEDLLDGMAEMYRCAAIICLRKVIERAVRKLSYKTKGIFLSIVPYELVQYAARVIIDIAECMKPGVPPEAGIAFPLFISGCITRHEDVYERVINRFFKRLTETGFANSVSAIECIKEIWSRKGKLEKPGVSWHSRFATNCEPECLDWVEVLKSLNIKPIFT